MSFKFVPPSAEELAARGVVVEKTDEVVKADVEKVAEPVAEKSVKTSRKKTSSGK